jgi:ankyrin repeat protein
MDSDNHLLTETERNTKLFIKKVVDGKIQEVEALIADGVNPATTKDRYGNTALMLAILAYDIPMVKFLMSHFKATDLTTTALNAINRDGYTALMIAAESGFTDVVQVLLSELDDNVLKDLLNSDKGYRASRLAVQKGFTEIIKLFIPHIHRETLDKYDTGESHLGHLAMKGGYIDMFQTVLFPKYMEGSSNPILPFIMLAAYMGQTDLVKQLIPSTDPAILNSEIEGRNILIAAIGEGHSETALALIPHLDSTTVKSAHKGIGNSFILAAEHCSIEVLKALKPHFTQEEINAKNNFHRNALMVAALHSKHPEVIEFLIHELDPKALTDQDSSGKNALILACRFNPNPSVVQFLVSHFLKTDPEALQVSHQGFNLLALAIWSNTPEIVAGLIHQLGTDVLQEVDIEKNNALAFALIEGKVKIVNLLMPYFENEFSTLKDFTDPKNLLKLPYSTAYSKERPTEDGLIHLHRGCPYWLLNTIKPKDRASMEQEASVAEHVSAYKKELADIRLLQGRIFYYLSQLKTEAFRSGPNRLVLRFLYPEWYRYSSSVSADENLILKKLGGMLNRNVVDSRAQLEHSVPMLGLVSAPVVPAITFRSDTAVQEAPMQPRVEDEQQPAPVVFAAAGRARGEKRSRGAPEAAVVVPENRYPKRTSSSFKESYKE